MAEIEKSGGGAGMKVPEEIVPQDEAKISGRGKITLAALLIVLALALTALFSPIIAILLLFLVITMVWSLYTLAQTGAFLFLIPEAHAVIIEYNRQYFLTVFRYAGRVMDPDGTIREAKEGEKTPTYILGGLIFVGIYPIFQLAEFTLRWKTLRPDGRVLYREETMKVFLLSDDVYVIQMLKQGEIDERPETIEGISIEVAFLMTGAVINPRRFKYGAQDPYEMVTNRIKQLIKEYVGSKKFEELITTRGESQEIVFAPAISAEFKQKIAATKEEEVPLLEIFKEKYGFRVSAVEPYSITPPPDLIAKITAKFTATQDADAKVITATGEAKSVLIGATAEIARIHQVYTALTQFGSAGLYLRTQEAQETIARTGKSTHYLAPIGSVNQISKILLGMGVPEESIEEASKKFKEMKVKPEELTKLADIMDMINKNPEYKAIFDNLTKQAEEARKIIKTKKAEPSDTGVQESAER